MIAGTAMDLYSCVR